ncbi:MAG TPA: MFS transporter [Candidatus Limnocylindria bacterium]
MRVAYKWQAALVVALGVFMPVLESTVAHRRCPASRRVRRHGVTTSDPVLDVRLFRNPTFTMANVLLWSISAFLFSSLFLLPIFFQQVQGHTPLQSGTYFILQGVATAAATALSGWLYNRVGPRILAILGFALITIGTIGCTQLSVGTTWQSLQVWLVLRGLGLGLAMTPLSTLALAIVSNRQLARVRAGQRHAPGRWRYRAKRPHDLFRQSVRRPHDDPAVPGRCDDGTQRRLPRCASRLRGLYRAGALPWPRPEPRDSRASEGSWRDGAGSGRTPTSRWPAQFTG